VKIRSTAVGAAAAAAALAATTVGGNDRYSDALAGRLALARRSLAVANSGIQVNHWIRSSGEFDAVADFATAVADPADPEELNPAYNSGDFLHPDDAGYRAIAATINPNEL
jgi:lysophospholipase L1-like esterase